MITQLVSGAAELGSDVGGPRTLASLLSEMILRDIVAGVLAPGSKLKMRELAERYQAGVVPLREAVSRLAMSGFVEAEDQRGFRVSDMSAAELEDIMMARQKIEVEALRDAIAHGDVEWEGQVLAAAYRLGRTPLHPAGQVQHMNHAWELAHDDFHATLLAGGRSKWLKQFAAILRAQSARYRHQSLKMPQASARDVRAEHEAIVDAVLARDAERACSLLGAHFAQTAQIVRSSLADTLPDA